MLLNEKSNSSIFNNSIRFKYSWRAYQEKFLTNFQHHFKDNHLHVIAPPGAGKTILGLEMVLRVNRRTLILAPTLTIKNQWNKRFKEFFDTKNSFNNISTDVKSLKKLNFSTYQGVYSLFKDFEDKAAFVNYFKTNQIEVLVLDEAHHLKREWWKVLMELKNNSSLIIIALTATPPFDSSNLEMNRYYALCGQVDEEISIPELVAEKALCPHQDYIYFSTPEKTEIDYIVNYRLRIGTFIQFLKDDRAFVEFLKNHPYYLKTEIVLDDIYKDPSYFSAILIFLNHVGEVISEEKLKVLGFEEKETVEFPELTRDWIRLLLQKILFDDRETLIEFEEILARVEKDLKKIGGIHNKKVNLLSNDTIFKKITNSTSKLNSVVSIVKFEKKQLQNDLRLVVLTDFIRKEFFWLNEDFTTQINKIGVVPIFHYLKKYVDDTSSLAVLSGTLVVVNKVCVNELKELFPNKKLHIKPVPNSNNFVEVELQGGSKNLIVAAITNLFERGIIKILVGTKSLLGEGWDAPSINSLILASNIGSFVSSNQMRGRAIRVNGEHKTGHIWHLASVDSSNPTGGDDIEKLTQRFESFVGLSEHDNSIKNGIGRIELPQSFDEVEVQKFNALTFEKASNRNVLKTNWNTAIENGFELKKVINLKYLNLKKHTKNSKSNYKDMVRNMFVELGIGFLYFLYEFVLKNLYHIALGNVVYLIKYFFIGIFMVFLPKTVIAVRSYFIFGSAHKLIGKIAETILQSMQESKLLTTKIDAITIELNRSKKGMLECTLVGASYFENSTFVASLDEVLAPIDSPKYVIERKNWLKDKIGIYNVHAVPKIFETNKVAAQLFFKNWKKHVGKSKLIYCRNTVGRKLILKARLHNLDYYMKKKSKTEVLWK
ncbi:Type III restriction enzyme, res subunit [Lutibacter oricola]|uniref:Type III restriction enzyme, res subunit n=1 Tax=Lutibacter oricola TaxID=762486 RepID=A0A1H3EFV4_9FLAO|nr:DEAD/DEAH box helicase family protein [Lutibacter oricola]SDX76799.1 Type III restriction enzyme, res subunit [Lutibacter oricola]